MDGNLAGRPSTFSMHVSFDPAIPLLIIYSMNVLYMCTYMYTEECSL